MPLVKLRVPLTAAVGAALIVCLQGRLAVATSLAPLAGRATPQSPARTFPEFGLPAQTLPPEIHPAVARIIVPEGNATSYGSGTLIDVREQFGLVVTNWHVVRDGKGDVEVLFPDGFRSKARPLKVDADWDLAALVIWRPQVPPVTIAADAPQPGDQLTICGYGQGDYRAVTGRCTQYYSPRVDFPQHMVELDVEARQGDSGGPIFNARGELAGVLFGAGHGTTLGSFGGRVETFLATLAPDIGRAADEALVNETRRAHAMSLSTANDGRPDAASPESHQVWQSAATGGGSQKLEDKPCERALARSDDVRSSALLPTKVSAMHDRFGTRVQPSDCGAWQSSAHASKIALDGEAQSTNPVEIVKSALAAVGAIVLAVRVTRAIL